MCKKEYTMDKINYTDIPYNLYDQLFFTINPNKVAVLYTHRSADNICDEWKVVSYLDPSKALLHLRLVSFLEWNPYRISEQKICCDIAGHGEYIVSIKNRSTKENTRPDIAAACPHLYEIYRRLSQMEIKDKTEFKKAIAIGRLKQLQKN